MLSFCIGGYLTLAILAATILWASLVAAKNGDQKRSGEDLENETSFLIQSRSRS